MKRTKESVEENLKEFMAITGNQLLYAAKPGYNTIYCFDSGQVLTIREIALFNRIYSNMKNSKFIKQTKH